MCTGWGRSYINPVAGWLHPRFDACFCISPSVVGLVILNFGHVVSFLFLTRFISTLILGLNRISTYSSHYLRVSCSYEVARMMFDHLIEGFLVQRH
jgi:hypothetical protein